MLSAIRKRLTYANVAMTLALVFAMTGGAYAANKYLITSTKQISPKVLKSLKGATGTNGAAGPAGAASGRRARGGDRAAGLRADWSGAVPPVRRRRNGTNGRSSRAPAPRHPPQRHDAAVTEAFSRKKMCTGRSPRRDPLPPRSPSRSRLPKRPTLTTSTAAQKVGTSVTAPNARCNRRQRRQPTPRPGNLCVYGNSGAPVSPPADGSSDDEGSVAGRAGTTSLLTFVTGGSSSKAEGTWAVTG